MTSSSTQFAQLPIDMDEESQLPSFTSRPEDNKSEILRQPTPIPTTPTMAIKRPPTTNLLNAPKRKHISRSQMLFNKFFLNVLMGECCRETFSADGNRYSFALCSKCTAANRTARSATMSYSV